MLYPSTYAASIASRGYLIQHNQPIGEGVKLSNDYLQNNNSKSKHHGGLKEIRGNVSKTIDKLKNELESSFRDELFCHSKRIDEQLNRNQQMSGNSRNYNCNYNYNNRNNHKLNPDTVAMFRHLLRTNVCDKQTFFCEYIPYYKVLMSLTNGNGNNVRSCDFLNELRFDSSMMRLIDMQNHFTKKYVLKQFAKSRFEYTDYNMTTDSRNRKMSKLTRSHVNGNNDNVAVSVAENDDAREGNDKTSSSVEGSVDSIEPFDEPEHEVIRRWFKQH